MTDDQFNNLIEVINGNTKAINQLHIDIIGLIDDMCDSDDDNSNGGESKEMTTYLDGTLIAK